MFKEHNLAPYVAGLGFASIIGFSFMVIKLCAPYSTPIEMLVFRFNFSLIAAFVVWLLNPNKRKIENKKPLFFIALAYIGFIIFQTIGLYFVSSVESAVIFATIPIMVQFLSAVFLKEHATKGQKPFILLTVISLITMIALNANNLEFSPVGMILLFISAVCMATNNVLIRNSRAAYKPAEMATATIILGAIIFNTLGLIIALKDGSFGHYKVLLTNHQFLLGTMYLGIGCIFMSHTLIGYMNRKLKAFESSLFNNLSTVVSILAGIVVLNEPFYLYQGVCSIVIIMGIIGVAKFRDKN